MSYAYPVELREVEDGAVMVTFPDLGGVTQGDSQAEALSEAEDLLEELLRSRMAHGEAIPSPSPANGRPLVAPAPGLATEVARYLARRARGSR